MTADNCSLVTDRPEADQAAADDSSSISSYYTSQDDEEVSDHVEEIYLDFFDPPESAVLPEHRELDFSGPPLHNFEILIRMTSRLEVFIAIVGTCSSHEIHTKIRQVFWRIGDAIKAFVMFVRENSAYDDQESIVRIGAEELGREVFSLHGEIREISLDAWYERGCLWYEREFFWSPKEFPAESDLLTGRGAQPQSPEDWVAMLVGGGVEALFKNHPQIDRSRGEAGEDGISGRVLHEMRRNWAWVLIQDIEVDW